MEEMRACAVCGTTTVHYDGACEQCTARRDAPRTKRRLWIVVVISVLIGAVVAVIASTAIARQGGREDPAAAHRTDVANRLTNAFRGEGANITCTVDGSVLVFDSHQNRCDERGLRGILDTPGLVTDIKGAGFTAVTCANGVATLAVR